MKYTRPLLLAASTLASLISACSQPADIQAPALTPQFGGIYDEISTHVSTNTADGVAIGVNKNYIYAKNPQDIHEEYIYGIQLQLRTYNEEGLAAGPKP